MTTTEPASADGLGAVAELAAQLRVDSVGSSTSAGSGHPTARCRLPICWRLEGHPTKLLP